MEQAKESKPRQLKVKQARPLKMKMKIQVKGLRCILKDGSVKELGDGETGFMEVAPAVAMKLLGGNGEDQ